MSRTQHLDAITPNPANGHSGRDAAAFYISDLYIDPAMGTIVGSAGEVHLEPKVMGILLALARNAGKLLSREELLSQNWTGGDTYDEALTQCIYQLRQQLAVAGGKPGYRELINTIPKRGYLLKGEIRSATLESPASLADGESPDNPATAAQPGGWRDHRHWLAIAFGLVLALALVASLLRPQNPGPVGDSPSDPLVASMPATLAVLPFTSSGQGGESDLLADGLADELLGSLSRNTELRVTARDSAFQFRGPNRDLREVGQHLGVTYLLDGSVYNLGTEVHIRTRLVDARTGVQLWNDEYERPLSDWFELQQELALEVTRALEGVLEQRSAEALHVRGTTSVEAHLEVLRARQLLATRSVADTEEAIEHLQRALLLDPDYALAYTWLADAILIQAKSTAREKGLRPVVTRLLDKALALDPGIGEAYALRAQLTDDAAAAESDLRRGLELNPSYARGYELLAQLQATQLAQVDSAVESIDNAIALDPLTPGNYSTKAELLMNQGYWEEAEELGRRALELNPGVFTTLLQLAVITAVQGNYVDAIGYAQRAAALDPRSIPVRNQLLLLYLAIDDIEGARTVNQPATPFGTAAILWFTGGSRQIAAGIYANPPESLPPYDAQYVSHVLVTEAFADADASRALSLLAPLLPFDDGLPLEVRGWGLYPYANLALLFRLSGDATTAKNLEQLIEQRMSELELRFPRQAILDDQIRAVMLAGRGREDEACTALQRVYVPKPRPLWHMVLGNPAFNQMREHPCMLAVRDTIDTYLAGQRERLKQLQPSDFNPVRTAASAGG